MSITNGVTFGHFHARWRDHHHNNNNMSSLWTSITRRKKLSLMVVVIVVVVQQLQLLFLIRWMFLSTSVVNVVKGFPLGVAPPSSSNHRHYNSLLVSTNSFNNNNNHNNQRLIPKYRQHSARSFPPKSVLQKSRRDSLSHHDDDVKNLTDYTHVIDGNGDHADNKSKKIDGNNSMNKLQYENTLLRDMVRRLELENELLKDLPNRIIIETFEGERKILKQQRKRQEEIRKSNYDKYYPLEELHVLDDDTDKRKESSTTLTTATRKERPVSSPLPEKELDADEDLWCDELDEDMCPVEPTLSFGEALRDRAYWLVGLLVMQSLSGFILSRHETLLAQHPFIVYFLTMLVGAGGNAGNQASVRVIRGLALGTLNEKTQGQFLMRELKMATVLSFILSLAGFVRAIAFRTPFPEAMAVTTALAMIVFTSIGLGAVLPIFLQRLGVDPAHSSTTIQVVMDIIGVLLTVAVSSAILDSSVGKMILSVF